MSAGIIANTMRGGFTDEGVELHAALSNIHVVSPIIAGNNFAGVCGGLIGEASLFVGMSECSIHDADIQVLNAEKLGGMVGSMQTSSNMRVVAFSGELVGGSIVGGIAAAIDGDCPIQNVHIDAAISGAAIVGGVAGSSDRAKVANCFVEGALTLQHATDEGGVGGVIGALATDILGAGVDAILHDNIVALQSIQAPADAKAHRIVGFSSCNDYEYDWDRVDYSKPQSEWPRIYFSAEKCLKDNYVISDLAQLDASIAATDTTTEGATMAASAMTAEWLASHGFILGTSVDAPWVLNEGALSLWFEEALIGSGIEDVWADDTHATQSSTRKIILDGQVVIIRDGKMYNIMGGLL